MRISVDKCFPARFRIVEVAKGKWVLLVQDHTWGTLFTVFLAKPPTKGWRAKLGGPGGYKHLISEPGYHNFLRRLGKLQCDGPPANFGFLLESCATQKRAARPGNNEVVN